jgi:aspartyl protease family protein
MRVSPGASNFAREFVGWVFIAAVVFACVFYFADIRAVARAVVGSYAVASENAADDTPSDHVATDESGGEVHLKAGDGGHFYSDVDVNGRSISAVVDTGATGVSLTYEDARTIGLRLSDADFTMQSQTANGTAHIAPVTLDRVQIGDIEVRNVQAFVAEPGKLFQTLLGMSFLRRLSHIDIRGQELVLVQ